MLQEAGVGDTVGDPEGDGDGEATGEPEGEGDGDSEGEGEGEAREIVKASCVQEDGTAAFGMEVGTEGATASCLS